MLNNWSASINEKMKEMGMTQEMLADRTGITRGAITHFLPGRRVPPLKQFQRLADILKVQAAWLQLGSLLDHGKKDLTKAEVALPFFFKIPILS